MIPVKDFRYRLPMYAPQAGVSARTSLETIALILAFIHVLYSLYLILLDISSIVFLFSSGQYLMASIMVIVELMKRVCHVLWFAYLTGKKTFKDYYTICIGITGFALAILGLSLGGFIFLIYSETHSMIQVMSHPFVIECATFVIADAIMVLVILQDKPVFNYYYHPAQFPYQVQPQMPEFEMVVPKPTFEYNGYPFTPYY